MIPTNPTLGLKRLDYVGAAGDAPDYKPTTLEQCAETPEEECDRYEDCRGCPSYPPPHSGRRA